MDNQEKTKEKQELPTYLMKIRNEIIVQLEREGFSLQQIADILSFGITKSRVHQILNETKR